MSDDTREKLIAATLQTLVEQGIAKVSARTIATTAGVNQALVFYHFGSVDRLLAAACLRGAEQRVAAYADRLAAIGSLRELLDFGWQLHEEERHQGYVAVLGQLLAGAQTHPPLREATAACLELWYAEIESVLVRVLSGSPLATLTDSSGLARALGAAFVGIELYDGVDRHGARRAIEALDQLSVLVELLEELGPVAERALRRHVRRRGRVREGA